MARRKNPSGKPAKYPSDVKKRKPAAPPPAARAVKRPRALGPAAPELAGLVDAIADELGDFRGGTCPSCSKLHGDVDRNCRWCGAMLRRACPKCERPVADNVRYCTGCGHEVPELRKAGAIAERSPDDPQRITTDTPPSTAIVPAAPAAPEELWEADDVGLFAAGVDAVLMKMDSPLLTDVERARIDKRTAVMANKYFRPGAKWRDEFLWVASFGKPLLFAMYIKWVVVPDRARERAAEEKKAAAPAAPSSPAPSGPINLERVV